MTSTDGKFHLLFAAFMAGGNATILENLQNEITEDRDVYSSWLRIEIDPKRMTKFGERRSFLIPGTLRNSFVTSRRIHEFEKRGVIFDAAYFFQHTICFGLVSFRNRVPYVIAMDNTPMFCAKNELWYANPYFNPKTLGAKAKHMMTRSVYKNAFHLLPISTKVRDSLIDDYHVSPEKITVVPPGIDINRFSFIDRNILNRSDKPFNIVFTGADFIRKGGDILVSVASQPEFQDAQFTFITKSFCGPEMKNMVVHDNISTNSHHMVELLQDADIFVLPTRADTFSIASLEAMATGLPVITVAVGGISDIVKHGETGFLIPQGDIQSLVEHIRILRNDSRLRYLMGLKSRKRVERLFNSKLVSDTVVSILKKAAGRRTSLTSVEMSHVGR